MTAHLTAWLSTLPLGVLYLIAAALAAFENVFPPFPSDIIVALAVFLAARQGGVYGAAVASVWVGSTAGAMLMYYVGYQYGSLLILEKLERIAGKAAGRKLQSLHARYGIFALFVSRFIPGVRAVVAPFAGAMRLPAWHVFVAIGVASALWYGFIAYLAYEAGQNWSVLAAHVAGAAKVIGLAAFLLAAVWGIVWYVGRVRSKGDGAA